ncbi:AlbA family DNA-binding domain-containing protein [Arundinibacter roseus]|uniref:ATP-binding protein n=1 Tax=Arundinibacter roseus TaxID=2070510 RepID=A0A4R4JVH8_9BACT|nr:ATP-binding protein [Arundinibacter roseus]TDB58102.1 ATP-binding protein [Arundinibacter roseus]
MDLRTLKELVRQGEGDTLEFKLKSNHPERIVREIVAFANSGGGKLLIGVGDDKAIKGLKYADEDEYILERAIEKYCTPAISYTKERIAISDEREVLIFHVSRGIEKPHAVLDIFGKKKSYVRVKDKSVQASKEMLAIMKLAKENKDTLFSYGEKEKQLMQLLEKQKSVTVESYATIAGIPRWLASRTLVKLVLANVLEVHPDEVLDRFTMAMY